MTVGIKSLNDRYLELITAFPPRPITCDADFDAVQKQVNQLLDSGALGTPEQDYLRLLGILIYDYEVHHEPLVRLTEDERAMALRE